MSTKYRDANLSVYPQVIKNKYTHVSIGDIHGNALKLIYTLMEEDVLRLNRRQYYALSRFYYKPVNELTAEDLSKFRRIINDAAINKEKAITLIGDELADRGENDYFTLLVLKKLKAENVNINIMLSNHSVEFIRDYEKKNFTGNYRFLSGQGESLKNMHTLIARGLLDEAEVREIVDQCYKPMVRGIGYTLSLDGELTLFSHAPIGLETVEALAGKFNIPYRDNSIKNLIHTIDEINKVINHLFNEKQLAKVIESEGSSPSEFPIPLNQPLRRLIWNRALGNELVTEPSGAFKVKFVHGHVGPNSVLKNGIEALPQHLNLDSLFGKSKSLSKTSHEVHHLTRQSFEITAKELTKEQLQAISKKVYEKLFNDFLTELKQTINQLKAKENNGLSKYDHNHVKAEEAATILIDTLQRAGTDFFVGEKLTANKFWVFKQCCEVAIDDAQKEFVKHREWHQQLNPLLRGILGLLALIPLAIPALVVSLTSKHGYFHTFFSNPTSKSTKDLQSFKDNMEKMVNDLEDEIKDDNNGFTPN